MFVMNHAHGRCRGELTPTRGPAHPFQIISQELIDGRAAVHYAIATDKRVIQDTVALGYAILDFLENEHVRVAIPE